MGHVGVAFSPDGKWLMTSTSPCRLWAVGTWREARQIGGDGLCFSPDGRLLVVVDASKVIRLVETETGRTLARLESPDLCGVAWADLQPRRVAAGGDHQRWPGRARLGPAGHPQHLAAMGLDWDAPAYSDDDPADPSAPPLPPLQVDLGPLAGHTRALHRAAEVLVERYTARLKNDPNDAEAYHHRGHALVN